jgi:DNA polymerase-4
MATRHGKPGGIVAIAPGDERAFLAAHALCDLPGVGPATLALLTSWNLRTVGDLGALDPRVLEKALGARGLVLARRARGDDDEPVRVTPPELSISRETSFEGTLDHGFVRALAGYLLDRACAELRRRGKKALGLRARVRHVDGVEAERYGRLPAASDRTGELLALLHALLEPALTRRVLVRFVGVTLAPLDHAALSQGSLFDAADRARRRLDAAVDRVRARHGFTKLLLAGEAELLGALPVGRDGFVLRTPSLSL